MKVKRLLLATRNPGKTEELKSLLGDLPALELCTPEQIGLNLEVEESGQDYAENAALKAGAFAKASGLPALADDSGLEVEALNGAPGLYSARFSPLSQATDADRRAHLLAALAGKPRPWKARFRSTVAIALPSGEMRLAHGECEGEIIPEERGQGGFGYDRIFLLEGQGRTMAELSMKEKNRLSHRARAIAEAKKILGELLSLA